MTKTEVKELHDAICNAMHSQDCLYDADEAEAELEEVMLRVLAKEEVKEVKEVKK